jgi:hypothetical protein
MLLGPVLVTSSNASTGLVGACTCRLDRWKFDWTIIVARYSQLIDTLHEKGFQIEIPPLGAALDAWHVARKVP